MPIEAYAVVFILGLVIGAVIHGLVRNRSGR